MESQETNEPSPETFEKRLSKTIYALSEFIDLADTDGYRARGRDSYAYSEEKRTVTFSKEHESGAVDTIHVSTTEQDGRKSELTYHFFDSVPFKSSFNDVEQEEDVPLDVQDLEDIDTLIEYVNLQTKLNRIERGRKSFVKQLAVKAVELDRAQLGVQRLLEETDSDVIDSLARMNDEELKTLAIQAVALYGVGEIYAHEQYLFTEVIKALHKIYLEGKIAESDGIDNPHDGSKGLDVRGASGKFKLREKLHDFNWGKFI